MCGIVGAINIDDIVATVVKSLQMLYKRGHEGAGFFGMSVDREWAWSEKENGFPDQIVSSAKAQYLDSKVNELIHKAVVGHTRYRTAGGDKNSRQPIIEDDIVVVHNGNSFDTDVILNELEVRGVHINGYHYSDTQLIAKLIASSRAGTFENRIIESLDIINPTHNLILPFEDKLYVERDCTGCHPLFIGDIINKNGSKGYIIASEDSAVGIVEGRNIREVPPGSILRINSQGIDSMQLYNPWLHESILEDIYVKTACKNGMGISDSIRVRERRIDAGRKLYEEHSVINRENTIVTYAPTTAEYAAIGYSEKSRIPLVRAIIDTMGKRGFLQPTQEMRTQFASEKYKYNKEEIEGKSVHLVEDSIVRGTTLWGIIKGLRENGASEVHVRSASPPITSGCYYGMNFTTEETLAYKLSIKQIETLYFIRYSGYDGSMESAIEMVRDDMPINKILNSAPNYLAGKNINKERNSFSLRYLSLAGMEIGYGKSLSDCCAACFTGEHWIKEWYEVRESLRVKNRQWVKVA